MTRSETGKDARADPIIDRIRDELEKIGIGRTASEINNLDWNNPRDRRIVRERFDDGGAGEAILPGFGETGHGENAREDCGDPHPFICDSCGQSVEFGRTCGMSVCARCAPVWVRDAGIAKSAKMRRFRTEKNQDSPLWQKTHHLIISPPPGWYSDLARAYTREVAQEKTREVAKFILEELRAQGILVRHSFRGERDDGSLKSESDDRGAWKQRLFSGREWYGDVRDELAWKPHYHAVVVADRISVKDPIDDGPGLSERVEAATGWVIHRIENDDGSSLPNDGTVARALTYALSHADIMVSEEGNNRSAVWEVGSYDGDALRSSGRFSARPRDFAWAEGKVRDIAWRILGIRSGTTDCGARIPAVDDPDLLAVRILEELYPDDPDLRSEIPADAVLYQVSEGNISVSVSTTSGGGGDVTVSSAFGFSNPSSTDLPSSSSTWTTPDPVRADLPDPSELLSLIGLDDQDSSSDECDCGVDHDDDRDGRQIIDWLSSGGTCDGTLIPLDEARRQGILEDDEWIRSAPHSGEALAADRDWPADLDPWRTSSPGKANPAIG